MSDLYDEVRQSAAGNVLRNLTSQQRDWLRRRESCGPTPQTTCLAAVYQQRIDELTALSNKAATYDDDELRDLHVVILEGEWVAQGPPLTETEKASQNDGFKDPISIFHPPERGQKVRVTAGQICLAADDCEDISWHWSRLGDTVHGPHFAEDFHLAPSQHVLEGTPTDKHKVEVVLVPGDAGRVSAIASVCLDRVDVCRSMLQPWTPVGTVKLPPY